MFGKTNVFDIWKIQRPLFASDGQMNMCLAYTYGKKDQAMIGMTDEDMVRLFGDEPKAYVFGEVRRGRLIVKGFVTEPEAIDW